MFASRRTGSSRRARFQRARLSGHVENVPVEWDIDKKLNVLWVADLGSKTYGGPTIANGRLIVGTNNAKPRNPKDVDAKGIPIDLGVIMCFDEKTGKFQWQTTFKKLES